MSNPDHLLVKTVPASQWRVSESLKPIWNKQSEIAFGNSHFRIHWIPAYASSGQVEIPHFPGLPLHLHAVKRNHKARLGPVVAVLVADYEGGAKPFNVQTLLLKELIERARLRGVLVYAITPQVKRFANHLEGYCWTGECWINQPMPYPDLVYVRYFGKQYKKRDMLIADLTKRGAKLINSSMLNKWDCYQCLKKDSLLAAHLPDTRLYKSIKDIQQMLGKYSELYLKPKFGFRGAGIARLSKTGVGYQLIHSNGKVQKLAALDRLPSYIKINSYIVQQGLRLWNYPRFYDLKVLVQNVGPNFVVTGKVARQAEPGRVTTHLHQGGAPLLMKEFINRLPDAWQSRVNADIDRIALRTAEVLSQQLPRLGEFSMDMGLDVNGKVWIIEVNGTPSRKSFRIARDDTARYNGYEHLIDYIIYDYTNVEK